MNETVADMMSDVWKRHQNKVEHVYDKVAEMTSDVWTRYQNDVEYTKKLPKWRRMYENVSGEDNVGGWEKMFIEGWGV